MTVPPLRAGIIHLLRIGAVTIRLIEPTATPMREPAAQSAAMPEIASVLELAGETTLADAQERMRFPIRLPSYPAGLGQPDKVFVQDQGGQVIILVWLEPENRTQARLSLHILAQGVEATKGSPETIELTTVNQELAVWTTGPYFLIYKDGSSYRSDQRRLIEGHVLIWQEDGLTYRLETDLLLEEAVRIAESLE